MKLDLLDRKILFELDKNSRVSYSKIAKLVKTSPQVVKYRVEQLYANDILLYCWPMIEYRAMDYFFGLHFIKLKNLTTEKEKELYKYLNSHQHIPIIMRGHGYADLIIAIDGHGIHHLNEIMQDLNNKFGDLFLDWDTVIPIGFSKFNRNYLIGNTEFTKNVAFTGAPVNAELKETDRKIISMLNTNARVSTSEIVQKTNLSYENVVRRIKILEKNGVIQNYTILLNHVKIGYPRYRLLVKFSGLTKNEEKKFFTYCNFHPNIIHHLKVLGNWNLVIDIEIESTEKLREILSDIKSKFSKSIQKIESTYVYEIDRFRDIPLEYPELNL